MEKKVKKLEENYDFIIIPAIVSNVIMKLYEGGPEITY